MQHNFQAVSQSSGEEYIITAAVVDGAFVMTCECQAGMMGQMCKHRHAILDAHSDDSAIIEVQTWFRNSKAHEVAEEIKALEAEAANIKKQVSARKAQLGRMMREGC